MNIVVLDDGSCFNVNLHLFLGDGSCFNVDEHFETRVELTGSDCDPVYKICTDSANIYASCRDGTIRKYNLNHI